MADFGTNRKTVNIPTRTIIKNRKYQMEINLSNFKVTDEHAPLFVPVLISFIHQASHNQLAISTICGAQDLTIKQKYTRYYP